MTRAIEYRFKIGKAFPSNDPIARWLVGLAMIYNDVLLAASASQTVDETFKGVDRFYFVRLTLSHFREAAAFLTQAEKLPPIKAFLEALPPDTQLRYGDLRDLFHPEEGSFLKSRLRPLRNRFFHYPRLTKAADVKELQDALENAADVESSFVIDANPPQRRRLAFGSDVGLMVAVRLLGTGAMEETRDRLNEAVPTLLGFIQEALRYYLRRLPNGVLKWYVV